MGGITLLQKLQKLYGARAVSDRLGKMTNVQTTAQGANNPFAGTFSKKYLGKNQDGIDEAHNVIMDNMQFAFGNQNPQQMKNFETNVNILFDMKFPPAAPAKAEAEILDLSTKKQVTGKGLDSLKKDLGLPQGVNKFTDLQAREYSANTESYRRPIIRQMLLKDTKIKLPDDVRKSLENKADLQRGADPKMDPLILLNEYYDVNFAKLDELEDIRFTARNETEAADEFLKKGGLEPKKDLGDKLKDLPDDIDPDAMAIGGRVGYGKGDLVTKGIPALIKKIKDKYGNKSITTADKIKQPQSALDRKMFEEFNQRNNQTSAYRDSIEEANRKFAKTREGKLEQARNRKLTKDEVEDFENEIGDALEAYDFDGTAGDAKRILKEQEAYKAEMFAEYKAGKLNPNESLTKAMDEVGGNFTGDLKYDADVLAPELAFQRGLIPEGGDLSDIADQMKQMDIYDEAYSAVSGQFLKNREIKKMQQFSKPTKTLEGIKKKGTIDISDENVMGDLDTFMREADPEAYKDLEQKIELSNFDPKGRKKNASGGLAGQLHLNRTGYDVGGAAGTELAITQALKDFEKYQKAGGKLNYKNFIASGKEGVGRFFNQGGRVGFKNGGMDRRSFLKLMGGLAALPVVGKFFKGAKVASKIPVLKNTTTTMPAWFPDLVDKFIAKGVGKKIDADLMEYTTKDLPGVKMTKSDDGKIIVEGQNEYSRPYGIEYEPPGYEVIDEVKGKAVKTKGDFRATDVVPESGGRPDDVPDFFPEQLDEIDDILGGDVRVMEEFATGSKIKNPKRGEQVVGQAEVRAESAADDAAERAAIEAEDYAKGGLAGQLL